MAYVNPIYPPHQYQYGGPAYHGHHHQQQQQQVNDPYDMMMMMETAEDRMEARAAEDLLDCDSSHELALPTDYLPCPNTVIVGRGKKVAQHAGNVRFRELVKKELTEYSAATTKAHKSSIIVRVLTEVRNRSHYAFVKQNLTTSRWYRVEETSQRITTAQAFRDALKENYKSSRAFKKLKREEEKKICPSEEAKEKKEKKKASRKKSDDEDDGDDVEESKMPPLVKAASQPLDLDDYHHRKEKVEEEPKPAVAMAAKPAKMIGNNVEDMFRAMLDAQQSAAIGGGVRLWNPNIVTKPGPALRVGTAMPEDRKTLPRAPAPIPNDSVSSSSSLLWSSHSNSMPWSNHSRKNNDYNKSRSGSKPHHPDIMNSNHSSIKWSNHSIMTISGHSTRSNSTIGRLMAKFAPSNADMVDDSLEPRPIPSSIIQQEGGGGDAMDMDLDEPDGPPTTAPRTYVPRSGTTFDEGIAMGLGNLSDHSFMSNMDSMHSVKGFTAEEIFADTSSMHGSNRDQNRSGNQRSACPPASSSGYRHMGFPML